MKVVIVTGGIGSGKSVACRYIHAKYGWPIYEADVRVKELYDEHPRLLSDIEHSLDLSLRGQNGRFVPQMLAEVIFSDSKALSNVEDLVFAVLTEDFYQWKSARSDSEYVILESATILAKPQLKGLGDVIVLIDAPVDLRAERAAERSGVTLESVARRMDSQSYMNDISNGTVESPTEFMILNTGSIAELEEKIDDLVRRIIQQKC